MADIKLGSFIMELATLAGIPADDKRLADIAAIGTPLPGDIASELKSKMLTEEAAKANPVLKRYFHAQALNGIDATLEELMDELHVDDELREDLKRETSTYRRVPALVKRLREIEEKRAAVNADTRILDYAVDALFASKQFANEGAPKKVNILTAKNLLDEDLKSKKIKVVRTDDNSLKLVQSENPKADYLENNKAVSFADYVDKLLGTHKLLKVTDPKPGKNPVSSFVTSGDAGENRAKLISAIDQQLEQIRAAGGDGVM